MPWLYLLNVVIFRSVFVFVGFFAMFVGLVFFEEPKTYWCALKAKAFAQASVHKALITPVEELSVRAVDLKLCRVLLFLYDVIQLW